MGNAYEMLADEEGLIRSIRLTDLSDWLEWKVKDFDDANAVSETELQLLIKFAEYVKEGH